VANEDNTETSDFKVEDIPSTENPTSTDKEPKSPQIGDTYDPRPHEDQARRHIAYLLIGLLWVVIGAIFILVAFSSIGVLEVKEFAVVLGPVVTLVSAATGFYYGTKTK